VRKSRKPRKGTDRKISRHSAPTTRRAFTEAELTENPNSMNPKSAASSSPSCGARGQGSRRQIRDHRLAERRGVRAGAGLTVPIAVVEEPTAGAGIRHSRSAARRLNRGRGAGLVALSVVLLMAGVSCCEKFMFVNLEKS